MYEVLSVADEVQRHRIFAYIAESRSRALGQVKTGVAGFTEWDLYQSMGYRDDHYCHSKEFRSNVEAERAFWLQLFSDCGFANGN